MKIYHERDTIAALATPPGRGGVAVIRLSGWDLLPLAEQLTGKRPKPRYAHYLPFLDGGGEVIDRGLLLYFPAPRSFTGQDVLELHPHGSPVVVDQLLERLYELGARPAQPGEFSYRAFLNGKIDLAQAEAIAALIESSSRQAARAALRSLEGRFSAEVERLKERLLEARVHLEATIDFSDEAIEPEAVGEKLRRWLADLDRLLRRCQQGQRLQEGMTVVIAGPPNVGKSSLLNALAEREVAIVTEIAGTTRDLLREQILIDGMPLHVVDTAGLRETEDRVERVGIQRAEEAILRADRLLLVLDVRFPEAERALSDHLPPNLPLTRIYNKIDLVGRPAELGERDGVPTLYLSAKTGAGIDLLRSHLKASVGVDDGEDTLGARRRHVEALRRAREEVLEALQILPLADELAAEHLRRAQNALGEITGEVTTEDLLGAIFATFCIGK